MRYIKKRENDFKKQEHTFNLQDLIDKKTHAMASYVSNEPIILHKKNIKYKIFHPKDYGFNFYSDILFTSSAFLNENEKVVKDFCDKGTERVFVMHGDKTEAFADWILEEIGVDAYAPANGETFMF